MKGPIDMLAILYQRLEPSELSQTITGKVAQMNRPAGSRLEDVVLNALPVDSSQLQQGASNVNIYVPDLNGEPDLNRLTELSIIATGILGDVYTQAFTLTIARQMLVAEPETNSHYANLRVAFQFLPSRQIN